jgi:hypothetical protein
LEWVGRLLAPEEISDFDLKFDAARERKVRTPQGNELANGQAG